MSTKKSPVSVSAPIALPDFSGAKTPASFANDDDKQAFFNARAGLKIDAMFAVIDTGDTNAIKQAFLKFCATGKLNYDYALPKVAAQHPLYPADPSASANKVTNAVKVLMSLGYTREQAEIIAARTPAK